MTTLTIPKSLINNDDLIVLPRKFYESLLRSASKKTSIPEYYLSGKNAKNLDNLVENGLKDYKSGKTIKASSLKEALSLYDTKRKNR